MTKYVTDDMNDLDFWSAFALALAGSNRNLTWQACTEAASGAMRQRQQMRQWMFEQRPKWVPQNGPVNG